MALRLPAQAHRLAQPVAEAPPPLRLLQRWQPPAELGAGPGGTLPTAGAWARWRRRLHELIAG